MATKLKIEKRGDEIFLVASEELIKMGKVNGRTDDRHPLGQVS
jgi:hypothetical protein